MKSYLFIFFSSITILNASDANITLETIQEKPGNSSYPPSYFRSKTAQKHSKEKTKKCLGFCGCCCATTLLGLFFCCPQ